MTSSARLTTLRFSLLIATAFVLPVLLHAQPTVEGWQALLKNDLQQAKQLLTQATTSDPKDARAWFGLVYEASIRGDDSSSWAALHKALLSVPDQAPYLYASMSTARFGAALNKPSWGAVDVLNKVVDNPDASGILLAMAYERLGSIDESKERVKDARSKFEKIGAILDWRIVGPFDNISGSGHDKVFPPERADDTGAVYKNTNGGMIRWQHPPVQRLDLWIDFTYFSSTHRGQFYSVAYVKSPTQQRVQMRLGTSGSFKLFVNDRSIRETFEEFNNDLDTYITECTLNEGWNKVLVKVGASDLDRCNFLLRITDERGRTIDNLTINTQPQVFKSQDPDPRVITNPYITFFTERIASHPDHLENYLLLAEAYLRNDNVQEAILVLRKARLVAPECILIDNLFLEAYNRSDRSDDATAMIEHISTVAPGLPLTLMYRFNEAVSQDRNDDADSILSLVKRRDSTSTTYYESAMLIAQRKSDLQRFTELLNEAFERYPGNYLYASLSATMSEQASQGPQKSIDIMKRNLAVNVSFRGLESLAKFYVDAGDLSSALSTYDRLFALVPPGCGFHSSIADIYIDKKEWGNALAAIDRAIAIAPNISGFWYKRGVIQKSLGKKSAAISDLQRSLEIDPSNFETRELIRDLKGDPHPFTYFPTADIDSIIRSAPDASAYPNDAAVYLYDAKRRVVYDGSRCEIQREYVARILTIEGIDDFKEVYLPANGSLVVEKAVVRKPRGREIPADKGSGQLVFKGIEPGDFIYVRYRHLEAESGRLSAFFADNFAFNGSYPKLYSYYAVLTPPDEAFQWRAYGIESEMVTTKNAYGELASWESRNEPAIDYEEDMPSVYDVDKRVELSSVPNWEEIILWYHDIARPKTRSSLEVRELMDSLFPRSASYSKEQIIAGVYRYITKDVRYSYMPFRQSGYVPQKAERVINTRIGDCKDVATLCIAMLAERNITSHHVLVQTQTSPFQRKPLPSIPFDHVIVAIPGDSMPLLLDLTADNVPISSIPHADLNAFSLVVRPGLREPMYLNKSYFMPNTMTIETNVDISDDNSAVITQTYTESGAGTQMYRAAWRDRTEKDRDKGIIEMLSENYPDVELRSVEIDDLDTLTPTLRFSVTFYVPNYMMEAGGFLIARLPWDRQIVPSAALSYAKRLQPMHVPSFHDSTTEIVRLNVPPGFVLSEGTSVARTVLPQITYERSSYMSPGKLTVVRSIGNHRPWVSPEEYLTYKTEYNKMVKEDRRSILFMPKGTVVKFPKKAKQ